MRPAGRAPSGAPGSGRPPTGPRLLLLRRTRGLPMSSDVRRVDADGSGEFASGVAQEWDDLADATGVPPWFRPRWFESWFRAFGTGRLAVLTARRGQQL